MRRSMMEEPRVPITRQFESRLTRERKVSCTRCTYDDDVSGPSLVFIANVISSPLFPSPDCISLFRALLPLVPSLEYTFPFLIHAADSSTFFLFFFLNKYLPLLGDIRPVSLFYLRPDRREIGDSLSNFFTSLCTFFSIIYR